MDRSNELRSWRVDFFLHPYALGHLVPDPQQLGGQLLSRGLAEPFVVQRGGRRPPQPVHPHAHRASGLQHRPGGPPYCPSRRTLLQPSQRASERAYERRPVHGADLRADVVVEQERAPAPARTCGRLSLRSCRRRRCPNGNGAAAAFAGARRCVATRAEVIQ
jgi:hypothetical protein